MSAGNWIAIAVAVVSGAVTVFVTRYVQRRQDRRERRQRVHASFKQVLLAAERLAGTTAPLNGIAWKRDQDMRDEERKSFYDMLGDVQRDLQEAAVDLTLEGLTDSANQVEQMFRHFTIFRYSRSRPGLDNKAFDQVEAFKASTEALRQGLPKILDDIGPGSNWWRRMRRRWNERGGGPKGAGE